MGVRNVGRFRTSARSEKKRVVGTSGLFKRTPIVGGWRTRARRRTLAEQLRGAEAVDVVHGDAGIRLGAFVRHEERSTRQETARRWKWRAPQLRSCEKAPQLSFKSAGWLAARLRLRCGLRCSANTHQRSKSQVYGESLKHVELFFSDWLPVCQKNIYPDSLPGPSRRENPYYFPCIRTAG